MTQIFPMYLLRPMGPSVKVTTGLYTFRYSGKVVKDSFMWNVDLRVFLDFDIRLTTWGGRGTTDV